ncbi:phiSA1p31-related protein [Streptomyces sp. C10-9-1]|uniref:phiSA1p31-related protein n=1 Tax=Streptomyces sp. C10-9-1 TaxID=1859285 RepID=UPI002113181C|nr:phiSA1p31-related protein [Streptomyces sp. C10-9-1]MCQ6554753.1 phiSA1p31-related protein [Streptomyces sp. C10-9-1]
MATAKRETRTVEETVTTLTLTDDEASSLRGVLESLDYIGSLSDVLRALSDPQDASTYVYKGVAYDLNKSYADRDNELWTFARFNNGVRGGCNGIPPSERTSSLEFIVENYGPLREMR